MACVSFTPAFAANYLEYNEVVNDVCFSSLSECSVVGYFAFITK